MVVSDGVRGGAGEGHLTLNALACTVAATSLCNRLEH